MDSTFSVESWAIRKYLCFWTDLSPMEFIHDPEAIEKETWIIDKISILIWETIKIQPGFDSWNLGSCEIRPMKFHHLSWISYCSFLQSRKVERNIQFSYRIILQTSRRWEEQKKWMDIPTPFRAASKWQDW